MTDPETTGPDMTGPSGHADDLVSAHLDGELDDGTDAWVRAHLEECDGCRGAADDVRTARGWVRSLPEVDAGTTVSAYVSRRRRMVRTGSAFVGTAAVVLVALGLTAAVLRPEVLPDVDALAAGHGELTGAVSAVDPTGVVAERTEVTMVGADMDDVAMKPVDGVVGPYVAPPGIIGNRVSLSRRAVYDAEDLTAVVYGDGESTVSVYEQPGRLDWDGLPTGRIRQIGSRMVWIRSSMPLVMVTEIGHLVVTVVSQDRGAMTTVIAGLPTSRRDRMWDHVHDACQRFTGVFVAAG